MIRTAERPIATTTTRPATATTQPPPCAGAKTLVRRWLKVEGQLETRWVED